MSGNIEEWCQDEDDSYLPSAQTDPTGPNIDADKVLHGSGWLENARYCRSSIRHYINPGNLYNTLGLRIARTE